MIRTGGNLNGGGGTGICRLQSKGRRLPRNKAGVQRQEGGGGEGQMRWSREVRGG